MAEQKFVIYTDGGSRGNPGPAAIGVVIKNEEGTIIKSYGETLGKATNNEAEYRAVISALEKLRAMIGKEKCKKTVVDVFMDSELVVRQLTGKYKIEQERLFPFFIRIWNNRLDFKEITLKHIPREKNKEADRMVNEALDKEQNKLL